MKIQRQPIAIDVHTNAADAGILAKKEITIYDIAKALSVSPSTVSRALSNGTSLLHKDTVARIRQKAQQLGYRQNFFASKLRSKRTQMIAAIVPRLNSVGSSNIVSGAEMTAREVGYNLVVSQSLNNIDQYNSTIESFNNNRVEGLLVTRSDFQHGSTHHYAATTMPQIIIEGAVPFHDSSTSTEKFDATYELTVDLVRKGCKRIAFVHADQKLTNKDPLKGYRKALHDTNTKNGAVWGVFEFEAMQVWENIMSSPLPPDGIIFANEITSAFSIHDHDASLLPDKQTSVKAASDSSAPQNNISSLSSACDASILEVGKAATCLLIALIESKFVTSRS